MREQQRRQEQACLHAGEKYLKGIQLFKNPAAFQSDRMTLMMSLGLHEHGRGQYVLFIVL